MARGCVAKPHTSQDVHVSGIRNPTWCSYVLLIVDSRNITGRHPPGNAYALSLGAVSVGESSLLPRRQGAPALRSGSYRERGDGPGPRTPRRSAKCAAAPGISHVKWEINAQAWCGGTLSRNQRSRSASSADAALSRSSSVVSGIASPKISLTTYLDRGVRPFITHLQCDEHHTRAPIAIHDSLTQHDPPCQGALRQHRLACRPPVGRSHSLGECEGSDLEAG